MNNTILFRYYLIPITISILLFILYSRTRAHPNRGKGGTPLEPSVGNEITTAQPRAAESLDPSIQERWRNINESQSWTNLPEIKKFLRDVQVDKLFEWKQTISFWGVLIDDSNSPIPDADIRFGWTDLSPAGSSELKVHSDENGKFSLTSKTGKRLVVSTQRSGFRDCGEGSISFEYADPSDRAYHRPDSNRPVLFRLIRKGPPESLVHRDRIQEFRAAEDPGTLAFDLLGQREVPQGDPSVDLIVRTSHGPVRGAGLERWFDWTVEVSVPDGGIQTGSECPPAAPEDGYQPQLAFKGKVEGRNTLSGISEWFFVKSRGGRLYSRVHLKVAALPNGGGNAKASLLEYSTNPSGSRNLEVYPELQVNEKYYVPRSPNSPR